MEDFETRIERIPVPVPPRLVITTRDGTREVPLGDGQLILGRGEDNDVVVAADAVSRRHASLELRDEGVLIKDLGSTNGIAVDGQVMPEILLLPDMQVTIGTSVALAYLPPEAAPTALEILEALAAAAARTGTGTGQDGAADEEVTATAPGPDVHTEEPAPQADILAEEPAAEATAEAVAIAEEPAPEADILVEEPVIEATAEADALAKEPAADVVVVEEEPGAAMAVVEEEPAADVVVIAEEQAAVMAVVEEEPAADVVVVEEEPVIEAIVIENEPADEAAVADEAPADSWYVARGEGEPAWQGGPYTWAQLAALAQDGSLTGAEFVWYESRQEWVVVSQVPELLPQPAAVAAPDVTVVLPIQGEPGEAFGHRSSGRRAAGRAGRRGARGGTGGRGRQSRLVPQPQRRRGPGRSLRVERTAGPGARRRHPRRRPRLARVVRRLGPGRAGPGSRAVPAGASRTHGGGRRRRRRSGDAYGRDAAAGRRGVGGGAGEHTRRGGLSAGPGGDCLGDARGGARSLAGGGRHGRRLVHEPRRRRIGLAGRPVLVGGARGLRPRRPPHRRRPRVARGLRRLGGAGAGAGTETLSRHPRSAGSARSRGRCASALIT